MLALFPNNGRYSVRKVVAYGSGFLDEVLALAVGLEEQVMILAAQPRRPRLESKEEFRQFSIDDHNRVPDIVLEAIRRAISTRGCNLTERLSKRMMTL